MPFYCNTVFTLFGSASDRMVCAAAQRRKRAVSGDNYQVAQLENFRLKVFRAVAEHLNCRKAAEQLFLTQPAVTLQIKALEDDLGIRLFDRTAGRVSLTPQGSVLLGNRCCGYVGVFGPIVVLHGAVVDS